MKKCKDCGILKEQAEFYGLQGECKSCTKKRVRLRESELNKNPEWKSSERKRHREKYYRLGYKEKHKRTYEQKKIIMGKYGKLYPEKGKAKIASQHIHAPEGEQKHHWSYNEEHYKDVLLLTMAEHFKLHRYMVYDQERMMYRTLDGVLLDSKERHLAYFESIKGLE